MFSNKYEALHEFLKRETRDDFVLTFEEIARQLGCSESYARRLTNKVKLAMEASL